jgi:hypothetical protein
MTSTAAASPTVSAEPEQGAGHNRRPAQRTASSRSPALSQDDGRIANEAKTHKLRRNGLRRRASARGLELRQSVHGYSLIDAGRARVEGRNDMTLDDVDSYLAGEP